MDFFWDKFCGLSDKKNLVFLGVFGFFFSSLNSINFASSSSSSFLGEKLAKYSISHKSKENPKVPY